MVWRSRRNGERMLRSVIYLLTFAFCLKLSSAQDSACSVTHDGAWTCYSIPDFTATDCLFSWANATDHVLANQEDGMNELVVMKSNRTLVISQCLTVVRYTRDCISEKMQRTWTCNVNCTGTLESVTEEEISWKHWIVPIVVIAVILLLSLLGYLGYRRYKSVKKQYSAPSMDDVERGDSQ